MTSERTEIAVIIKQKYKVRLLEYKDSGSEFTEIIVHSKEGAEKERESSDDFVFCFTVKGKGEEEKERINKMNEREFDDFISRITHLIKRKYLILHK